MPPKLPSSLAGGQTPARGTFSGRTRGQSMSSKKFTPTSNYDSIPAQRPSTPPFRDRTSEATSEQHSVISESIPSNSAFGRTKDPNVVNLADLRSSRSVTAFVPDASPVSRRPRSLTTTTSPPMKPNDDDDDDNTDNFQPNEDLEGIFWIRARGAKANGKWKRRLMRLRLNQNQPGSRHNIALASIEVLAVQQKPGSETEMELKDDPLRLKLPLDRLQVVRKDQIPEKKPLEYFFMDHEQQRVKREFKYGQLTLLLHFSDCDELGEDPLEIACISTTERDAWHDWFTTYIVHCELQAVRRDLGDEYRVSDRYLGEPPNTGVQKFINTFIAGAVQQRKKEEAAASKSALDIKKAPCKGFIFVKTTEKDFEKRKISCPGKGRICIGGGFGVFKETIDVASSLVVAETPWGANFFIRLSQTAISTMSSVSQKKPMPFYVFQSRVELRTDTPEERNKMIEWILFCKGIEQSNDETYPYEAKERAEAAQADAESDVTPRTGMYSGFGSMQDSSSAVSEREREDGDSGDLSMMYSQGSYIRVFSDTSIGGQDLHGFWGDGVDPLLAKPITDADMMNLVLGPEDDLPGTWSFIEYNTIGGHPTPQSCFSLRLVSYDSTSHRIYVTQGSKVQDLIVDIDVADIFAISGYSKMYGITGFTIHTTQGIELHIVPRMSALASHMQHSSNSSERAKWLRALRSLGVFAEGKSREEVNEEWLMEKRKELEDQGFFSEAEPIAAEAAHAPICLLTGANKNEEPVCELTNCVYPEYLDRATRHLGDDGSSGSVDQLLPPMHVRPAPDPELCVEAAQAAAAAAEAALSELQICMATATDSWVTPKRHVSLT